MTWRAVSPTYRGNSDLELVGAVLRFFRQNLDRSLLLEQVIDHFGVNPSRVKHAFLSIYGQGPMTCFARMKLEQAKKMLVEGRFSPAQVAQALGYASPAYFSRVFKAKTGSHPGAYAAKGELI